MIRVHTASSTTRPRRARTLSRIAPRASLALDARRRRSAAAPSCITYYGVRTLDAGAVVLRVGEGPARVLPNARDVEAHSIGLEWGYAGQGPRQLAIALLADAIGADAAHVLGRRFYERVTSLLPAAGWKLTRADVLLHARALGSRAEVRHVV